MDIYDRKAVGERIRARRKLLGLSQEEFAERIGRVPKFCADIERGQAGMSIDTMLSICNLLKLSPDYILLGRAENKPAREQDMILAALEQCTERQRKDAYALLKLFLSAIQ